MDRQNLLFHVVKLNYQKKITINIVKDLFQLENLLLEQFSKFSNQKKFNKQKQGILLLNGKQLFDGYISSEKIEDRVLKYNSKKFYNTGDIVQKIKNNFYFIKRDDSQIKKNGFRIELDEIDNLIQGKIKTDFCKSFFKFSKINLVIKSKKSKKFIIKMLEKYLPHYMIPDKIIFIKSVPLNKNFKIDNKKFINQLLRK